MHFRALVETGSADGESQKKIDFNLGLSLVGILPQQSYRKPLRYTRHRDIYSLLPQIFVE
jgi:hypothetical protein